MRLTPLFAFLPLTACVAPPDPAPLLDMANPASVYCEEQGGRLEMRDGPDGTAGYCHLPDGQVIEEWEFFRRSTA